MCECVLSYDLRSWNNLLGDLQLTAEGNKKLCPACGRLQLLFS